MIYPLLLLLSGSVKSEVDIRHFDIIPQYLVNDLALFRKLEEQRYGGQLDVFIAATRQPTYSFEFLERPPQPPVVVLQDWNYFWSNGKSWPPYFLQLGHNFGFKTVPEANLMYLHRLAMAFPDLPKHELNIQDPKLRLKAEEWQSRSFQTVQGPFAPVYVQMKQDLPLRYFRPTTVEGFFITHYLRSKFGTGEEAVQKLNHKWDTHYSSLYEMVLSPTMPVHPGQGEDWWNFVQNMLSARFIRFSSVYLPDYQKFLETKYREIGVLNEVYKASFTSWKQVSFPGATSPVAGFSDAEGFIQTLKSPKGIFLDAPEFQWREFLKEKYHHDLAALNLAYRTNYSSFDAVRMPVFADDWKIMQENRSAILYDFLTRNYRVVWEFLTAHGHAVQNTLIFCFLNVLTALIINPLAAYALSRFQPRWTYQALFILMATMTFPVEVTQIPAFLILRQMGWLNTFAALVIPAAANGYSIFLLKGFFDSLPKDLYESANLDGASELRIFTTITIPLSTPILAFVALSAFTSAYGAFMFALLVCQKESMWTLMVYIYQLQQFFNPPIIFAALVLAAIPTLLVFVFCQNIIMRGIVIPVEK